MGGEEGKGRHEGEDGGGEGREGMEGRGRRKVMGWLLDCSIQTWEACGE